MQAISRTRKLVIALATAAVVFGFAAPAHAVGGTGSQTGSQIASLASDNLGKHACSTNSLGGTGFMSSCTGNGGQPEYWCADFAKWAWKHNGIDVTGLTAAAYSFYSVAKANHKFGTTPVVGSVAIFSNNQGDTSWSSHGINHVAIVSYASGSNIKTISGDWGGSGSTQAQFASSSDVFLNTASGGGAYNGSPGNYASPMGMWVIGYAYF